MSDVTKDSAFDKVRADVDALLGVANSARLEQCNRLRSSITITEQRLTENEREKLDLIMSKAKHCAELARLEAMSGPDILRDLLPTPEPEQPTVAEHVKAPGMYALYRPDKKEFWAIDGGWTAIAAKVQHYNCWAAEDACKYLDKSEAWELNNLQIVDGLLVTKPGVKPAILPRKVRS